MLSHGIELALIGQNALVTNDRGLADLINDDTSLIMIRLIAFEIFPR